MKTRTVIRWNEEEREKLLLEVFNLHDSWPYYSALELVRRAQITVLPSDRRREITGTQQVEWVQKKLDKYIQDKNRCPPVTTSHESPKAVAVEKPELKELLVQLLIELGTDILKEVVAGVTANLKTQQHTVESISAVTQPHTKKQLKKVTVYGLIPSQINAIRTQFKDCFEFRFLKDVSPKQLVAGAGWADVFILMTKFISHDYEAIKRYKNIDYCNGGVSELTMMLEDMYVKE